MSRKEILKTAFSQPDEVHAFVHGLYKALITANPKPSHPESIDELHYWRAGYLVGKSVHVLGILVIANTGLNWV
jgi:hypothetical protein